MKKSNRKQALDKSGITKGVETLNATESALLLKETKLKIKCIVFHKSNFLTSSPRDQCRRTQSGNQPNLFQSNFQGVPRSVAGFYIYTKFITQIRKSTPLRPNITIGEDDFETINSFTYHGAHLRNDEEFGEIWRSFRF